MRLRQPVWPRFLPTSTVLAWATLGPIGRRLPAPGTWGSVAGLLYFTVVFMQLDRSGHPWVGVADNLVLSSMGAYLAVGFCGEAEFRLGRKDPGEVILDEFVALPLCYLGWTFLARDFPPWVVCLAGLALFRFYDVLKPGPIGRMQDRPAGWGIVLDDTAAALATCLTLHLARWAWLLLRR